MNQLFPPQGENTVKTPAYPTFVVGDRAIRKSDGYAFEVSAVSGDLISATSVESYPKRGHIALKDVHRKHFRRADEPVVGDEPSISEDDTTPLPGPTPDDHIRNLEQALTKVYGLLDEQKALNQQLLDNLAFERGLNATRPAQPQLEALRVTHITSDDFASRLNEGWRVTLWNWEVDRLDVMFVREAGSDRGHAAVEAETSLANDLFSHRRLQLEQMAAALNLPVAWAEQSNRFTRQAWESLRHNGLSQR